ncbi:recombinase family protein, partial [Altererythrobacter salegens]|nr:recombinase family protein [Croceibacterium salegens]
RIDAAIRRTGRAVHVVHDNGMRAGTPEPQQHLVKLLHTARCWWQMLCDEQLTVTQLAARLGMSKSWMTRVMRLSFLAPEIIEAIIAG